MKKILRYGLLFIGIASFTGLLAFLFIIHNASIQVQGVAKSPQLIKGVTITRSDSGIPVINAQNMGDLMFAQGYVTAQDRLMQMVMYKYIFSGRLSELVGSGGVEVDRYMRMMNFANAAKSSFANFDPEVQYALTQYAKGVNFFIAQNQKPVLMRLIGVNLEQWKPEDNLLVAKAIAWDMQKIWTKKLSNFKVESVKGHNKTKSYYPSIDLGIPSCSNQDLKRHGLPFNQEKSKFTQPPPVPKHVLATLEKFAEFNHRTIYRMGGADVSMPGSNAWALAPKRSETKSAILASDPHLSVASPNIFHLVSLKAPGIEITGAAIPGSPGVIIGRNKNVSWGFTNGKVDQSDIYYTDKLPKYTIRKEQIKVKGQQPVDVEFLETDHGVVVNEDVDLKHGPYVIFSWVGRELKDTTLQGIYFLNSSSSVNNARVALKNHISPPINAVLADNKGNIAYQLVGRVPKKTYQSHIPVPLTSAFLPKGFIPFSQLPRSVNPESGFVYSTNNRVVSGHYPYLLTSHGYDDGRVARLIHLVSSHKVLNMSENMKIQADVMDNEWMSLRSDLVIKQVDSKYQKAYNRLFNWDGYSKVNAIEPTIFGMWLIEMSQAVYSVENKSLPKWGRIDFDALFLKQVISSDHLAAKYGYKSADDLKKITFQRAIDRLNSQLGKDMKQWKWGVLHKAKIENKIASKIPGFSGLYNRYVPVEGARHSINCMRWNILSKPFEFSQGPSLRMQVDMMTPHAMIVIPMGESENPFTNRFDNLLNKWANADYVKLSPLQTPMVDDYVLKLIPDPIKGASSQAVAASTRS